jgi:hypothetical protein
MPHTCGAFFVWYVLILYFRFMKQSISIFIFLILCACSNKQFSFRQKIKVGDNKPAIANKPSTNHINEYMLVDTFLEASITSTTPNNVLQPSIHFTRPSFHLNNHQIIQQHLTDTLDLKVPEAQKQAHQYSYNAIFGFMLSVVAAVMLFAQYFIGLSNIFLLVAAIVLSGIAILLSEKALTEDGKGSGLASIGFLLNTAVLVTAMVILLLLFIAWLILTVL